MAKKQPMVKVYCVELNKTACRYMRENVVLNRLRYVVEPLCGDVRMICPKLGKFNRVVMPLPKEAHKYLGLAMMCTGKGGVVHFYHCGKLDGVFKEAEGLIKKEAKRLKRKVRILARRPVLPYGPGVWKVCIEFAVH